MNPSLRIVVADDEPMMRMYLHEILTEAGYHVAAAVPDGIALLEACRNIQPDLVITDLTMPGLRGNEVLRILAKERHVATLVLSALDESQTSGDPSLQGIKCLAKPVGARQILEAVEELCEELLVTF